MIYVFAHYILRFGGGEEGALHTVLDYFDLKRVYTPTGALGDPS